MRNPCRCCGVNYVRGNKMLCGLCSKRTPCERVVTLSQTMDNSRFAEYARDFGMHLLGDGAWPMPYRIEAGAALSIRHKVWRAIQREATMGIPDFFELVAPVVFAEMMKELGPKWFKVDMAPFRAHREALVERATRVVRVYYFQVVWHKGEVRIAAGYEGSDRSRAELEADTVVAALDALRKWHSYFE